MSNETEDNGVVSKPMGGLYAGPASGGTTNGPAITSTGTLHAPQPTAVQEADAQKREAQDREAHNREMLARHAQPSEAQKKEIEARKKGAAMLEKHDKALDKAKEEVAKRTPEDKTGHSASPTVRQDEEMAAAKVLAKDSGAPHIDLATGEKNRPFRYDPDAAISHSITPTVHEDEVLGVIPQDRAITKEEAEKKTDFDTWVGSNERQQSPNDSNHRVFGGEYDGHVTVSFKAGNGYNHSFSFDLPNVIGNLGVAGLNDVAITEMIEHALIGKLGSGGVVKSPHQKSEPNKKSEHKTEPNHKS